MKVIPKTP